IRGLDHGLEPFEQRRRLDLCADPFIARPGIEDRAGHANGLPAGLGRAAAHRSHAAAVPAREDGVAGSRQAAAELVRFGPERAFLIAPGAAENRDRLHPTSITTSRAGVSILQVA